MKILYLDCQMGAAGDMLAAALLDTLDNPDDWLKEFNQIGLENVKCNLVPRERCGIQGAGFEVYVHGIQEHSHDVLPEQKETTDRTGPGREETCHGKTRHEHVHTHHEHAHHHPSHGHGHHHGHVHSSLKEIEQKIEALKIPESVKKDVSAVYTLLARAEGKVHGKEPDQIHFHEVGTLDALADITAVCLLMHEIKAEQILASSVHVGGGQVRCAHGILPVPAPATALLLEGIPIYGSSLRAELCTPTGAALLRYFVQKYAPIPEMRIHSIGYGMGKKEFHACNCLRAFIGEGAEV